MDLRDFEVNAGRHGKVIRVIPGESSKLGEPPIKIPFSEEVPGEQKRRIPRQFPCFWKIRKIPAKLQEPCSWEYATKYKKILLKYIHKQN